MTCDCQMSVGCTEFVSCDDDFVKQKFTVTGIYSFIITSVSLERSFEFACVNINSLVGSSLAKTHVARQCCD
jgi:hypothetical protein